MGSMNLAQPLQQRSACLLFSLCVTVAVVASVSATVTENYIVLLNNHRHGKDGSLLSHRGYLEAVLDSPAAVDQSLIYHYKNVFNGFAAKLTVEQVAKLSKMHGVVSVLPNTRFEPATTNSWKFLGLESKETPNTSPLWEQTNFGEDIIIGIVDTGIWPESISFSDAGIGPIPAKWKGECVKGESFNPAENCNRKLIGARYYYAGNSAVNLTLDYKSSRDNQGHGTHVASTAAGNFAPADYFGYAKGTAKGGVPKGRIAVYKVCWKDAGCSEADMAAAMDDAITDGVDLMSISISGSNNRAFHRDVVAIASFQAIKEGILVNFAAGNSGPTAGTVNHVEPWSFTVAATSQDRFLGSDVLIKPQGDSSSPGLQFRGATYSNYTTITASLISGSEAAIGSSSRTGASFCNAGTLSAASVRGKVVFCLRGEGQSITSKSTVVRSAGGIGMIVGNVAGVEDYTIQLTKLDIPAVHVTANVTQQIVDYIKSRVTTATIFKGTTYLGVTPAPVIAYFSSTGPSGVTTDISKPDIAAPGYNIVAAWINGKAEFNQISGTSMATPHISGIVAIVKAAHPDWSPAAIKSAIMTTAKVLDNTNEPIKNLHGQKADAFSTGSGLVDPVAAIDPGLIYDADWQDYALFLCSLKYTDAQIQLITGETGSCAGKLIPTPSNLNYPSVSVGDLITTATITRKVTNVGKPNSVYDVSVEAPTGVSVTVNPTQLSFSSGQQTQSFSITLRRLEPVGTQESYVFGSFKWSDGVHVVRSRIVVGNKKRPAIEDESVDDLLLRSY